MRLDVLLALLAQIAPAAPLPAARVRPLPGQAPCAYPAAAERRHVGGPVRFVARVTPEGFPESVEVTRVPEAGLGFEETVRACVLGWRFDRSPDGATEPRAFEGSVRYEVSPSDEALLRRLVEDVAAAWNARDARALEDAVARPEDLPGFHGPRLRAPADLVRRSGAEDGCRLELDPWLSRVRFLRADVADVAQRYRCAGPASPGASPEATLDARAVKLARGWRFVTRDESDTEWLPPSRVGGAIPQPRRIKSVDPEYPPAAVEGRVQGVVILECTISETGRVTDVRVLRGIRVLDRAAVQAVRQWEYEPTLIDGKPVPVIMTVTVTFRLGERPLAR